MKFLQEWWLTHCKCSINTSNNYYFLQLHVILRFRDPVFLNTYTHICDSKGVFFILKDVYDMLVYINNIRRRHTVSHMPFPFICCCKIYIS